MRILHVEDSDAEATLARHAIQGRPTWEIVRVSTLAEAKKASADSHFDVAVVDFRLPDGDGLDFLQTMRATQPGIPVIFLTGQGSEDVALEAFSRGAVDYIVKDTDMLDTLADRIANAVQQQRESPSVVHVGTRPDPPRPTGPRAAPPPPRTDIADLVKNDIAGIAVLDAGGRPIRSAMPRGIDIGTLGATLALIDLQVGTLRHIPGLQPHDHVQFIHAARHMVATARLPDQRLLVVLFDPSLSAARAFAALRQTTRDILEGGRG